MIGYAYVCGDPFHVGHLNHLESCKALCDELVVGVLTDKAVMEKKPRPIIPFHERLRIIQALKCVDLTVAQSTYSPMNNALMMADVLFESTSHDPKDIEMYKSAMKVIVMPYYTEQSSTKIKERIKNGHS